MTNLTITKALLNTLDAPLNHLDCIRITGTDPQLPSPFAIAAAGCAALATLGYLAMQLWLLKSGQTQQIKVDARSAAICQNSHRYLRFLDRETPKLWSPLSGIYKTKDHRHIQLHCNSPDHTVGVLDFLRCDNDRNAVEKAVRQIDAESLEYDLSQAGCAAAMIRSQLEWQSTEQFRAISQLPLIQIDKLNGSAPTPLPIGNSPLSGIRVLDLTRVIAGPVCGKVLAEHGATVMRISSPKLSAIEALVADTGPGKLNAFTDLTTQQGIDDLWRLITVADVFIQAYRPGALEKFGFTPEAIKQVNPSIIYVSLSAYSHVGPWAHRHGYDSIVQSATGIVTEHSSLNNPSHLPAQSLDYLSGFLASAAIMRTLHRRATEGGSYHIRLSLAQTGYWFQSLPRAINYQDYKIHTRDQIEPLLTQMDSGFGRLECLKPVLNLSITPPLYRFAAKQLGSDAPSWPDDTRS